MAKRITQTIRRDVVDATTGEVITMDTQKTFTEKVNPEKFYMTFIDYISPIYQLNSEVARRMLDWMCEHAIFNTGIVDLSTSKRQQMCSELKLANNQVTNNLKKLKDLNLISGEKGTFKINPEIFWKGELSVRRKELLENKDLKVSFELIDRE